MSQFVVLMSVKCPITDIVMAVIIMSQHRCNDGYKYPSINVLMAIICSSFAVIMAITCPITDVVMAVICPNIAVLMDIVRSNITVMIAIIMAQRHCNDSY